SSLEQLLLRQSSGDQDHRRRRTLAAQCPRRAASRWRCSYSRWRCSYSRWRRSSSKRRRFLLATVASSTLPNELLLNPWQPKSELVASKPPREDSLATVLRRLRLDQKSSTKTAKSESPYMLFVLS